VAIAQSALTTLTVLCGLLLVPFVAPPTPAWVGGNQLSGDWRPSILALLLFGAYGLILAAILAAVAAVWAYLLRFTWRKRLLDRFLGVDLTGPPGTLAERGSGDGSLS